MTDHRSLERAARSWIEAGPTHAPERAVEAALLRIESTPQERDVRVPWRFLDMNASGKIATGAAAAVAVTILGVALLSPGAAPGPGASESSPTPTPAILLTGPLAAGTYRTDAAFPVAITWTVPQGWSGLASGPTVKVIESDAEDAARAYLSFWVVQTAQRDPCGYGGRDDSAVGPSVRDLATALAELPGFDSTPPKSINVDGVDGEYVELIGPPADCVEPELWATPDGSCRCMDSRFEKNRIWMIEVDGTRLAIDASYVPPLGDILMETSAIEIAELTRMVNSIQILR
jgi:hypothetical protein